MTNSELYNCCTNMEPPNWSEFDALEIGGCVSVVDEQTGETHIDGGISADEAEFFTVYGHCTWGGAEALTDCKTLEDAKRVAARLSEISGLEVSY